MIITYHGAESFKVQFGDTILGFNPISKNEAKENAKSARYGADIAFISLRDPLFSGVDNLSFKEKEPFVIFGPGEYEIKEVFVKGYQSQSFFSSGSGKLEKPRINTVFSAKLEGMHLVFLGALGKAELGSDVLGELGEVDILFVPIGGEGVLSPHEAYRLAVNMGAKIVIPMHYEGVKTDKDALQIFLKEGGVEKSEKKEKLTIKPKDLIDKENEIVVLGESG
ncbi:MAG TPA: MBL fold metallo-hydrolase [Candidatus Paceibacterota bacterium]|nr:MBL fold metallo-hydrolase [Candidatus Paceibacterota bacterium]